MRKVFCWGTFDRLHKGHIDFFKDAKKQGDYLAVIVVSDATVYENKGRFPIHTQEERARALERISIVNEVILARGTLQESLERYALMQPDVFAFGYDQDKKMANKIQRYFNRKRLNTQFYTSREFAGGIHDSQLVPSTSQLL